MKIDFINPPLKSAIRKDKEISEMDLFLLNFQNKKLSDKNSNNISILVKGLNNLLLT